MNETLERLKSFFSKSKRVWLVLKKPTKDDLLMITKISAIGIGVIGVLGFFISIVIGYFL